MGMTEVFIGVVSLLCTVVGFFIKRLYDKMDFLETTVHDCKGTLQMHRIENAREFVRKEDMKELKDDIKELITPLSEELTGLRTFLIERFAAAHKDHDR